MRNFFRVINSALAAAALLVAAYAGYMGYSVWFFPVGKYEAQEEELARKTEQTRAQTIIERRETEELLAFLSADLRNNGEDALALADGIDDLEAEIEEKTETLETLREELAFLEDYPGNISAAREDYGLKIRELEEKILAGETDLRICYWTLDDGPSYYTQQFVDAAKELGVYLTFFTSREANESAYADDPAVERELLRQEAMGGHSIQNHTNSHQYSLIAGNLYTKGIESFREQVQLQHDWVVECTGIAPDVFRFPGGSAHAFSGLPKDEMLSVLDEMGYVWIDWSCDIFDNGKAAPTIAQEAANAVYEVKTMDIAVLLSHDWNANTLEAFKRAVPQLQELGYVFLPLFSESWTIGNTEIIFY